MKDTKWLNEVKEASQANNGVASLNDIYQYVKEYNTSEYKDDVSLEVQNNILDEGTLWQ